jgi:hypothetical protein
MFVEQAGCDLKNLKPLDVVMPVNLRHTEREWQKFSGAQVPSPRNYPTLRLGTEPQPGKDVHHTLGCSS